MTLGDILALYGGWFARTLLFVFGLLWGSFLNVVIYRVPLDMSVVTPPSHCPACGVEVKAYDNIPVVSYLVLRGRARCCGAKMSPRYLFVELIGGAVSLALLEVVLRHFPEGTSLVRASAIYVADFGLAMGLVAAAFIDLEHMYLPDPITIGGTVLGVATCSLRDVRVVDSLLGGAIGFVVVWLPFNVLYKVVRGKVGMGVGDAKLAMLAGAWFGWPGAVFALFAGAVQGTLAAVLVYLVKGKLEEPEQVKADREELKKAAAEGDAEAKEALEEDPLGTEPEEGLMAARLPFGPFLILGILEFLFVGRSILARWFGSLGG
jgi:leader peptidase (prepilin peptidase)/N-methyltransferase